MAYLKKEMSVNWCTSPGVRSGEQEVVNGVCERCGVEMITDKASGCSPSPVRTAPDRRSDDVDYINVKIGSATSGQPFHRHAEVIQD